MEIVKFLKKSAEKSIVMLRFYHALITIYLCLTRWIYPDKLFAKKMFKKVFGRPLNLENPQTLNEKIQWLKLYDRNEFQTICADKYAVRKYVSETFGEEYLIPVLFQTTNYKDIIPENIPDCKCILKPNHDQGNHLIITDKTQIDYQRLRENCRYWLSLNKYYTNKEWQYKNISPRRIVIEKLLETKEGKLPNDYKLVFINGKFEFCYVSYDRQGINDRCTYDENWNRLPFVWNVPKPGKKINYADVPKPETFELMKKMGAVVAKNFKLVRVDFYDVDGKLYFGEITLHHGGGFDHFTPDEYDLIFGKKLKLQ